MGALGFRLGEYEYGDESFRFLGFALSGLLWTLEDRKFRLLLLS